MSDEVGKLIARLGWEVDGKGRAELEGFKKGSDEAEKSADKLGKTVAGLGKTLGTGLAAAGAAAVGAAVGLFAFVNASTQTADAIGDAAAKARIATDEYQRLAFTAKRGDVEMGVLAKSVAKLSKNLDDARTGGAKPFVDALDRVGLTVGDLGGTAEENLAKISDALLTVEDPATRSALSMDLLGKGAIEMAQVLDMGGAEIMRLGERAEKLGLITEEQIAISGDFQDAMDDTTASVTTLARDVGIALAPAIQDIAGDVGEWAVANREVLASDLGDAVGSFGNLLREILPLLQGVVEFTADWAHEVNVLVESAKIGIEFIRSGGDLPDEVTQGGATGVTEAAEMRIAGEQARRDARRAAERRRREQERAREEAEDNATRAVRAGTNRIEATLSQELAKAGKKRDPKTGKIVSDGKKRGGGGKKKDRPVDFDADDFELLEAEELAGAQIRELAAIAGLGEVAIGAALQAVSSQIEAGATSRLAIQAGVGRIESLSGMDFGDLDSGSLDEILLAGPAGRGQTPTAGAQFVHVDQSFHATVELNMPPFNLPPHANAAEVAETIESEFAAQLDRTLRQIHDYYLEPVRS